MRIFNTWARFLQARQGQSALMNFELWAQLVARSILQFRTFRCSVVSVFKEMASEGKKNARIPEAVFVVSGKTPATCLYRETNTAR